MADAPPVLAHAERGEDQITNQNVINNYFIGPRAANMPDFRANINTILDELLETRLDYYPEDHSQKFITKEVRRSPEFQKVRDNFGDVVRKVAQLLGEHSVPFWSPRYEAHMCTDLTMPSLLGYFMTMLYNPNNVALEASPMTTVAELLVGQQLGELFGYKTPLTEDPHRERQNEPMSWGHITCDGTVANLESIWVARNLKFYPLALHQAIVNGNLNFIADRFEVETCRGGAEKFARLATWDLLNLKPKTVLDLPDRLYREFGISSDYLKNALEPYNIQSAGLLHEETDETHHFYRSLKAMKFIVSKTNHYSWPKGLAIAGLGSANLLEVEVDDDAHIDLAQLRATLNECLDKQIPVYAVVAVIGSTEEGAVDRLSEIVRIRNDMQEKGLSFLVHADAAWGGYFATMLRRGLRGPERGDADRGAVPALTLRKETETDLLALRHADSITVDPHKAGYIPYPAGSLVYRDGRMRYLVTWSSPYLSQGSAENIGVYGVEGSKPGAAAMSTWLSNQTIGLDPDGYGKLLGQASFTSSRLSVRYAVHSDFRQENRKDFICVPFNRLPREQEGHAFNSPEVEADRDLIRMRILGQQNEALLQDPVAMNLLRQLGSDTNINAFALNFYVDEAKTTLNTDIEEANYLMKRVVDRLSITGVDTDPTKIPVYLTSTKFEPKHYGACAKTFMRRLGLTEVDEDLFVLRNVVMSPFPTKHYFIGTLWDEFERVVNEEVQQVRKRNDPAAHKAQFLLQGIEESGKTFLVLQTSFHTATLRQQLIVRATLSPDLEQKYRDCKNQSPETSLLLVSQDVINLQQGIRDLPHTDLTFNAEIYAKVDYLRQHENPDLDVRALSTGEVTITKDDIIKSRPLNVVNRDPQYPKTDTPFYLYGTPAQQHISHVLVRSPNVALSAANVSLSPDPGVEDSISADDLANGLILALAEHPEVAMQPVTGKVSATADVPGDFFFSNGKEFKVNIWRDPHAGDAQGPGLVDGLGEPFWTGTLTLREDLDYDSDWPNKDPAAVAKVDSAHWREELLKIGNVLNAKYRDPAE
ncbi:pyridoxal phosphate-dependent decarboxylase family protein [Aspergillus fijiensis CBS 313.89]|uniref:PLP-dependent transferase n=1 Tax=Aspergillus fijiensis CBS 313.89 TaxID=1448319 RepID=A0A8G1W230_9EURO|nr:PLP-dependent transferase [Aspergillus fijiensis CBS 313.89]RAK80268.1 PLP-dependent transferase [Aspergillus fijiensis CBS 313.89]